MLPAEIIRRSAQYLERHGVQSPRETAESLLMQIIGTDRAGLYARVDGLDLPTARLYGRALCRRCKGVPLQYITGEQQFLDLVLSVMPGVFVPRPETEGLALAALEVLEGVDSPIAVDVGTGTGAVALALKSRVLGARVLATDVSEAAVELATSNAARLGLEVEILMGDLLDPVPSELRGRLDLIVSNPPYVSREEYESLPTEVRAEPYEALVGGTEVHASLAEAARAWLGPRGWLVVEIAAMQAAEVSSFFDPGFEAVEVLPDLAGRDRVVRGRLVG